MKTENIGTGDPIWTNNVELLTTEECLPVIGSCQVSSILQNLDTNNHETNLQNMDLIILHGNDFKLPLVEAPVNLQTNYVVLKDNGITNNEKPKTVQEKPFNKDNFENMLYFVCNLCPFLCTKDSKITEHLENAHKNKMVSKLNQLKCPACANVFYHKMSLRSHLIHDHGVSNSDLNVIIQAVVYYSNKNKKKDPEKNKIPSVVNLTVNNSTVADLPDKNDEVHDNSNEVNNFQLVTMKHHEKIEEPSNQKVNLPQVDIAQNSTEKIFNNLMKKPDPIAKYINTKKCLFPMCKVRLVDVSKLNYHIECHTDQGYKCLECNEKFMFWKPLSSHLWRLHKIDMELFSCEKCDYKTYSLAKLNNIHKFIHGDIKGFRCDLCDKAFKNSKQLRNHKIVHKEKTDKVGVSCEVCLKKFSDKRVLKAHMDIVHKKIKPFLCSYCGYKGSSKSALKTHTRLHTGEKPFSCDDCSYITSDHNSLRRHKLRHTGQKPYKCAYCSYACIQSSTYKVHLKTKHPGLEKDLMFTCQLCQFRSVNKEMYTSHMVTVHKQKPQVKN